MIRWIVRFWNALFGQQKSETEFSWLSPEPLDEAHRYAPQKRIVQRVTIARFSGDGDPPPFRWKACHPSTMTRFKAKLCCPAGHSLVLKGHSIDASGLVWPSVVCPESGCNFHEFVELEDWDLGDLE